MKDNVITLDHGSGGKRSGQLIQNFILKHFGNPILNQLHDGALLPPSRKRMAFSTDSYTVSPLFFPGGNIGNLAVHGTINDLAMCGAKPEYLSVSLIMEEGLNFQILEKILCSMAEALKKVGVQVVTGDTKVVRYGEADGLYINTTGIGMVDEGVQIHPHLAQVGDLIIVNGSIGNHGISILSSRESLQFEEIIQSDSAPLSELVSQMLNVTKNIHVLRDPTRGGLATSLNEIAQSSQVQIEIEEDKIPIEENVQNVCDILGYDPLYLANEGKLVAFVPERFAQEVLKTMQQNEHGEKSVIIGRVISKEKPEVVLNTAIGGKRLIGMLSGQQLPRIC